MTQGLPTFGQRKRLITYLDSVLFLGLQAENTPPALYSIVVSDWPGISESE